MQCELIRTTWLVNERASFLPDFCIENAHKFGVIIIDEELSPWTQRFEQSTGLSASNKVIRQLTKECYFLVACGFNGSFSDKVCSGLIEMDTLIKDNVVNYWSPHESKTSIQELPKRV
ncbi:MAG: hypothetical protein ACI9WC_003129 [Arenicella sp.]|jgi:hypothetical protein